MRQGKSVKKSNRKRPASAQRTVGDMVCFEPLESRLLLSAAGPSIVSVAADNRGHIVIEMDTRLNQDTVNGDSVRVYTAGADFLLGTADDVLVGISINNSTGSNRITVDAEIQSTQRYRLVLDSSLITDMDGNLLDGEFNGAGVPSGDGVAGGDFQIFTRRAATSIVRFTTIFGTIDVELFDDRPITVSNFLRYANDRAWDNTFFHRNATTQAGGQGDPFVLQGGGFNADAGLTPITQRPAIQNEPGRSNLRGTIAMAKLGNNPNSATNQWFFNLGDNSENLDNQNGGFTVFGQVTDDAGLAVIDSIADLENFNASAQGSAFTDVPVRDLEAIMNGTLRPEDLVVVSRVALLVDFSGEPSSQLPDEGAVYFTAANNNARVTFFDLTGAGLGDLASSVQVKFGKHDTIKSIKIKDGFTGVFVGMRIDGASSVGPITDLRKGTSNLAFVVSETSVKSFNTKSGLSGWNLNDFVLPGGFHFDEDIDADGDFEDELAFYSEAGLISKFTVGGDLSGDVVAKGGIKSVSVTGLMNDADFVIGNQNLLQPTTTTLKFYRADNSGVRSSLPVTSFTAAEWLNSGDGNNVIQAPTLGTLSITGDRRNNVAGDFGADLTLNVNLEPSLTLTAATIAGSITGGEWSIAGPSGPVSVGEDVSNAQLDFTRELRSFTAQSVSFTTLESLRAIEMVTVEEWFGGELAARSIKRIQIKGDRQENIAGDFLADLTLNAGAGQSALTQFTVAGDVGNGTWMITGDADKITVGGNADALNIDINGNLNTLDFAGVVTESHIDVSAVANSVEFTSWTGGLGITGQTFFRIAATGDSRTGDAGNYTAPITVDGLGDLLIAGSLQGNVQVRAGDNFDIRGDILDSVITITQQPSPTQEFFALTRLTVGGSMLNSELRSRSSVSEISIKAMSSSGIYVGAPTNQFGLPDTATGMNLNVGIGSIEITGFGNNQTTAFNNSFIVAGKLGTVRVMFPETANNGQPFGIAAGSIVSINTRFSPNGRQTAANPPATLPPIGDYQVRVNFTPPV